MNTDNLMRGGLIILAAAVLIYLACEYSKNKANRDGFEEMLGDNNESYKSMFDDSNNQGSDKKQTKADTAKPYAKESMFKQTDGTGAKDNLKATTGACFPKDKLTAEDLLPKDSANSKWSQVNPAGQGDLKDLQFLNAGYHVGINTVGNTLRNPNLQIRSEPPNPQTKVSPWNQTTIESDFNRRPLEIGGCE